MRVDVPDGLHAAKTDPGLGHDSLPRIDDPKAVVLDVPEVEGGEEDLGDVGEEEGSGGNVPRGDEGLGLLPRGLTLQNLSLDHGHLVVGLKHVMANGD